MFFCVYYIIIYLCVFFLFTGKFHDYNRLKMKWSFLVIYFICLSKYTEHCSQLLKLAVGNYSIIILID